MDFFGDFVRNEFANFLQPCQIVVFIRLAVVTDTELLLDVAHLFAEDEFVLLFGEASIDFAGDLLLRLEGDDFLFENRENFFDAFADIELLQRNLQFNRRSRREHDREIRQLGKLLLIRAFDERLELFRIGRIELQNRAHRGLHGQKQRFLLVFWNRLFLKIFDVAHELAVFDTNGQKLEAFQALEEAVGVAIRKLFKTHDTGRRADGCELLAFDAFHIVFFVIVIGFFGIFVVVFHFTKRIDETENMICCICITQRIRLEAGRERKREHEAGKHRLAAIDHQMDGGAAFGILFKVIFVLRDGGAGSLAVPFAEI